MNGNEKYTLNEFKHGVSQVAGVMGRSRNLRVVFEGTQPMTNERIMTLPALPEGAALSIEQYEATRGYVYHESKHVADTDFDTWEEAMKEGGPMLVGLLNGIEDVRLDAGTVREYAGARVPLETALDVMSGMTMEALPEGSDEWAKPGIVPASIGVLGRVSAGIACKRLDEYVGRLPREMVPHIQRWGELAAQCRNTGEALELARQVMREIGAVLEPQPAEGASPAPSQPGSGGPGVPSAGKPSGDDAGSGGDAAGGDEAKESGKAGGKKSKGGREKNAGGDGEDRDGKGDGEDDASSPGSGAPKPRDYQDGEYHNSEYVEGGEVLENDVMRGGGHGGGGKAKVGDLEALKKAVESLEWDTRGWADQKPHVLKLDLGRLLPTRGHTGYVVASDRNDVFIRKDGSIDGAPSGGMASEDRGAGIRAWSDTPAHRARYRELVAGVSGQIGVAQRRLEAALRAVNKRDMAGGFLEGRLDSRAFAKAVSRMDPYAFRQRVAGAELDTAVQVVIDLSGSMRDASKSTTARITTILLAEVLERMGVPFEVIGFNSYSFWGLHGRIGTPSTGVREDARRGLLGEELLAVEQRALELKAAGASHVRVQGLDLWLFKEFQEPLVACRSALGSLCDLTMGSNFDGDCLLKIATRLYPRRERRKIMVVLSDGRPAGGLMGPMASHNDVLKRSLVNALAEIESHKVEMIGIGILTNAVREFYRKHVVVENVEQLGTVVMGEVGSLLLNGWKRRVA